MEKLYISGSGVDKYWTNDVAGIKCICGACFVGHLARFLLLNLLQENNTDMLMELSFKLEGQVRCDSLISSME